MWESTKKSSKNFGEGDLSFSFVSCCARRIIQWRGCRDKSPPGFGDRLLSHNLGPLLGLASRQGTDREELTLALRFHFREVTERNPNEQKPTKVFESPVTPNHQDRAQLQQQLPGAAQGWERHRDGCQGCRLCIGTLPGHFPAGDGSAIPAWPVGKVRDVQEFLLEFHKIHGDSGARAALCEIWDISLGGFLRMGESSLGLNQALNLSPALLQAPAELKGDPCPQ